MAASAIGVVAAVLYAGLGESVERLARLDLEWVSLTGTAMLAGVGVSILRFRSVLRAFGYIPDGRTLLSAFFVGHVSNAFLMNVVGQSVTRSGLLRAAGIPPGVTVAATFWERLQAASLLFVAALGGGFFLVNSLTLDLAAGGLDLMWLLSGVAVALGAAFVVALRAFRPAVPLAATLEAIRELGPSLLLTVLVHVCTLVAWFTVLRGITGAPVSIEVGAALLIVMFASSIPVSMAGWGLRELSAAYALTVVGIAPSVAVAAAVTVGGIGLGLVAVSGGLAALLVRHPGTTPGARAGSAGLLSRVTMTQALPVIGVLIVAVLLYFQVRVPTGSGELTANLADPAAMTAGGLLAVQLLVRRSFGPVPRPFALWLIALTAVIGLSLVVGYAEYGLNEWAIWNRGVGWLVLLGYVAAGAAAALAADQSQLKVILGGIIAAGLALTVFNLLAFVFDLSTGLLSDIQVVPIEAFAGNENARAVQLVCTFAVVAAVHRARLFGRSGMLLVVATGILGAGMYLTFSRSGYGMLGLGLALVIAAAPRGERSREALRIALGVLFASVIVAVCYALPEVLDGLSMDSGSGVYSGSGISHDLASGHTGTAQSDTERWKSLVEGWQLWVSNPILGSGLGAQVERYLSEGKLPLVIHNTPLWLLAETGVVGFSVALGGLIALMAWIWRTLSDPSRAGWALGAGIVVVSVAGGGMFHDFAYQRIFWFLLALFLALGMTWRPHDPSADQSATDSFD